MTTGSRPASIDDQVVGQELEQLWSNTPGGGGGYRGIADLSDGPSLYATSWNLRLASLYGVRIPNLSVSKTAAWLDGVLTQPEDRSDPTPPLERVWLAVEALDALHQPIPTAPVEKALSQLRVGDRYSYLTGTGGSWAAALTAVEVMQLAHVSVPDGLVRAVSDALGTLPGGFDDGELQDAVMPLLQLADDLLPASTRTPIRAKLQGILERVRARVLAPDVSLPFALSLLVKASDIAHVNALVFPEPVDAASLAPYESPDGYVSLSPTQSMPDPHLTFDAGRLGVPLSRRLADVLRNSAGPAGWWQDNGMVDPKRTFYAVLISEALGTHRRDAAIRQLSANWLDQFPFASVSEPTTADVENAFYLLALAQQLNLAIPADATSMAQRLLQRLDPRRPAPSVTWVLRLVQLLRIPLSPGQNDALVQLGTSIQPKTMGDAYRLQLLGALTGSKVLQDASIAAARALALDGGYRAVAYSPVPDLQSTSLGLLIVGGSDSQRQRAVHSFATPQGTWILPVGTANGNRLTLETVYLGYFASGRTPNPLGLLVN